MVLEQVGGKFWRDMGIIRTSHKEKYTVITNAVFKSNLSLEAKGLFCQLLSYPDNFEITKESIMKKCRVGKHKLDSIFKELKDIGCLEIRMFKNDGSGKFSGREWVLREDHHPGFPHDGFTGDRKTGVAAPLDINNNIYNNNIYNNNIYNARESDERFEMFWGYYPKRSRTNNKQAANRQWDARLKEGVDLELLIKQVINYQKHCESAGIINTPYVMMASTFLGRDKHYEENWEVENANAKGNRYGQSLDELAKQRVNS